MPKLKLGKHIYKYSRTRELLLESFSLSPPQPDRDQVEVFTLCPFALAFYFYSIVLGRRTEPSCVQTLHHEHEACMTMHSNTIAVTYMLGSPRNHGRGPITTTNTEKGILFFTNTLHGIQIRNDHH